MRICLATKEYHPETPGGIGTYYRNLAEALTDHGHEVHVVSLATDEARSEAIDGAVHVVRVPPRRVPAVTPALHRFGDGKTFIDCLLISLAIGRAVREIVPRHRIEIVQFPESAAIGFWYGRARRPAPMVVRFHTPLFLLRETIGLPPTLGSRIVSALERASAQAADGWTAACRSLAEIAGARFRIPVPDIRVIPNTIDLHLFTPNGDRPQVPCVLFVGQLARRKGVFDVVEAIPRVVREIPAARFVFIGSDHPDAHGPSTVALLRERLAAHGLQDRAEFLPRIERTQLVRYYQQAALCLVPSLWENIPNTCLEAMATGTPVVGTAVGGIAEVIRDGVNGLLIPPQSPAELAEAVTMLLKNAELRRSMGSEARRTIETTYSPDRVVRETVATYESIVARDRVQRQR